MRKPPTSASTAGSSVARLSGGQQLRTCHHIDLAIVGSWHGSRSNEYAEATLHAARKAGLMTATYIVVIDKPSAISYGLEACGNEAEHLSFVALDIEVRGVTEKSITDSIRDVHAGSHRAAIYTGAWFWQGRLGNPKWASHIPALGLELQRPPDARRGRLRRLGASGRAPVRGHQPRARVLVRPQRLRQGLARRYGYSMIRRLRRWLRGITQPECIHLYVRISEGQDGRWRWELQEKQSRNAPRRSDRVRAIEPVRGFDTRMAAKRDAVDLLGRKRLDAAKVAYVFDYANED